MTQSPTKDFVALPRGAAAERDAALRLAQYLLTCGSMRPSAFTMPVFAAVVCFVLSEWISPTWLALWWGAVALFSSGNAAIDHWQTRSSVTTANVDGWIRLRCIQGFVFNVNWTLPAFMFWSQLDDLGRMFLILIYACSMSGGIALSSACRPWAISLMPPLVLAIVVPPAFGGTWFYWSISFLSLGFSSYMGYLAVLFHNAARDAIRLQDKNADLVAELSLAKAKSDEACARAEAASRAKSDFLANMSHELRTPLNAVIGFSELIERRIWGDGAIERYVDYAQSIRSSGQYLLHLINDILDLAKIEAGKFELNEGCFELTGAACESLRLVETQANTRGVRMLIDASERVCVFADERAIRQVMANLLSNAVKFTPKDGTVRVFIVREAGGEVSIVVRDSGVGIRPEDLQRVMESFGQGRHEVAASDERGTGLGLPIVKGLVEAHGGSLRIESEVGRGTAVTVTLPASRLIEDEGGIAARKRA